MPKTTTISISEEACSKVRESKEVWDAFELVLSGKLARSEFWELAAERLNHELEVLCRAAEAEDCMVTRLERRCS